MKIFKREYIFLSVVVSLFFLQIKGNAELYKYVDDKGKVWYTNQIKEKYLDNSQLIKEQGSGVPEKASKDVVEESPRDDEGGEKQSQNPFNNITSINQRVTSTSENKQMLFQVQPKLYNEFVFPKSTDGKD